MGMIWAEVKAFQTKISQKWTLVMTMVNLGLGIGLAESDDLFNFPLLRHLNDQLVQLISRETLSMLARSSVNLRISAVETPLQEAAVVTTVLPLLKLKRSQNLHVSFFLN